MTEALQLEIRTLRALLDSERDPGGRAFAPLADAYRRAGRVPEALRVLREGIAKHPDFVTGHVVAAQLYVEQGLSAEGAFAARRALELDAENVCALKSLLRALDESRATQEAEGIRTLLTALEPDFAPDWATSSAAVSTEDAEVAPSPAIDAPEEVPEVEAEPEIETALLDLATIGPIPSADLPLSALAPEPEPPFREPFVPLDLATALEVPRAAADEQVMDLAALAPEATFGVTEPLTEDPVFDLATLAPPTEEAADDPVMDLAFLAPEADAAEAVMDLATLAPDAEAEPVMDLAMLAPDADESVMDLATLAPDAEAESVMDLAMLAPDAEDEAVMDLASLAPDAEDEAVMDLAALAPDDEEPAMDLAMLAPEPVAEEPVMDLAMLAPDPEDEAVMDLAALAPDDEEPVMDLAMLAPEPVAEETVMDLAMLAPDDEESVMDLAMLAPEPVAEETVMDLAMLAPEQVAEETVMDLAMLAPSSPPPSSLIPEDEPVFDLDALAPTQDAPAPGTGNGQMAVEEEEPNEVVVDLDPLRPEPAAPAVSPSSARPSEPVEAAPPAVETPPAPVAPARAEAPIDDEAGDSHSHSDEQGTPIFTRTLAELYAAQGATKEAVQVMRRLLSDNPQDAGLASRIAELEAAAGTTRERAHERKEDEVEALARDLAEGDSGAPEVDSPFVWTDREAAKSAGVGGPTIRQYFDELLEWEPREGE